jgi:hypothetical protein
VRKKLLSGLAVVAVIVAATFVTPAFIRAKAQKPDEVVNQGTLAVLRGPYTNADNLIEGKPSVGLWLDNGARYRLKAEDCFVGAGEPCIITLSHSGRLCAK